MIHLLGSWNSNLVYSFLNCCLRYDLPVIHAEAVHDDYGHFEW